MLPNVTTRTMHLHDIRSFVSSNSGSKGKFTRRDKSSLRRRSRSGTRVFHLDGSQTAMLTICAQELGDAHDLPGHWWRLRLRTLRGGRGSVIYPGIRPHFLIPEVPHFLVFVPASFSYHDPCYLFEMKINWIIRWADA